MRCIYLHSNNCDLIIHFSHIVLKGSAMRSSYVGIRLAFSLYCAMFTNFLMEKGNHLNVHIVCQNLSWGEKQNCAESFKGLIVIESVCLARATCGLHRYLHDPHNYIQIARCILHSVNHGSSWWFFPSLCPSRLTSSITRLVRFTPSNGLHALGVICLPSSTRSRQVVSQWHVALS